MLEDVFMEKWWVRRVVSLPSGETAEWWNRRVVTAPGGENAVVRAPWWERRVVRSPGIVKIIFRKKIHSKSAIISINEYDMRYPSSFPTKKTLTVDRIWDLCHCGSDRSYLLKVSKNDSTWLFRGANPSEMAREALIISRGQLSVTLAELGFVPILHLSRMTSDWVINSSIWAYRGGHLNS